MGRSFFSPARFFISELDVIISSGGSMKKIIIITSPARFFVLELDIVSSSLGVMEKVIVIVSPARFFCLKGELP